jgi:hypothetical protein
MPYPRTLHEHLLPEYSREAPPDWERRLREISPITDTTDHLVFRWMEPDESWRYQERGCWMLYGALPRHLVPKQRAGLFEKHWSEMPKAKQMGRMSSVSTYQHFMWHTKGLDVIPFWVLQGSAGGMPYRFTKQEARMLELDGQAGEPPPVGYFPPCPFDERVVNQVLLRDRLLQVGMDLTRLAKLERPETLRAADQQAEEDYRRSFLRWWDATLEPQREFMMSQQFKSVGTQQLLPDAPAHLPDVLSMWRDHFIQHGVVIGAGNARSRRRNFLIQ